MFADTADAYGNVLNAATWEGEGYNPPSQVGNSLKELRANLQFLKRPCQFYRGSW